MSRETVEVPLSRPITTHEGKISKVVLQEAMWDEYLTFGDPWVVAGANDGTPFGVENIEVIKQYLAIMLVSPKDPALLSQVSARDARRIKNALLGFFQPAEKAGEASATSPTNSSSEGSGSAPANSAS
jgi:hypothetical protein